MEVKKIKVHEALTCKLDDDVKDIARKLKENKERRIFVVDNSGKLVGLITTTDLVYNALCEDKNLKAKDVMTKEVKCVDVSEDLDKALAIMDETKSFVCPVVKEEKVLGIVTYHDLVNYVFKEIEK